MSTQTMSATVASKEFGRYMDTVQRSPVIITKKNRPVAVTLSMQDAQDFRAYQIEKGIQKGLSDIESNKYTELTPETSKNMLESFKDSYYSLGRK